MHPNITKAKREIERVASGLDEILGEAIVHHEMGIYPTATWKRIKEMLQGTKLKFLHINNLLDAVEPKEQE